MSKTFTPQNKAIWEVLGKTKQKIKNVKYEILFQN